jgi:hypothetical protein
LKFRTLIGAWRLLSVGLISLTCLVALITRVTSASTGSFSSSGVACSSAPIVINTGDNGGVNPAPGAGTGTLRQAMIDACSGGTITFNIPTSDPGFNAGTGVYTITLLSTLPAVNSDLTITGLGASQLTVQRSTAGGTPDFRIFTIAVGVTLNISSLKVSNGRLASGNTGQDNGGCIYNNGTLTITNSEMTDNRGDFGAGIYNLGSLTVINSSISNNHSIGGPGAAILSTGTGNTMTLINSTVANNVFGDAIFIGPGTGTINNCTISNNTTQGGGGGILVGGPPSTILNVTNSTITGNRADSPGNTGGLGGGIEQLNGTVTLHNTIVAGNFRGTGTTADDVFGTLDPSSSFNLFGVGGSGGLVNGVNNNQVGVVDALLGPLANNGGTTLTHALLYNSPAIDRGDDCVFNNTCSPSLGSPLTTDERGSARQADGDNNATATVDIGAYERQSSETRTVRAGSNVSVDLVDARLIFPSVSVGGGNNPTGDNPSINPAVATVSITVIDPAVQGAPPNGYSIGNSTNPALPAFDISPSSNFYTGPVSICFYLPSITDANFFAGLKILHKENNALVDPGSRLNFSSKIVCTQVSSFSPFVIAHTASPTAVPGAVSGRILDERGIPVAGAAIRMSGNQNRLTVTDAEGNYHFDSVGMNGFYTVTPSLVNYSFNPGNRSFTQNGNKTEAVFTATSTGESVNPLEMPEYFVRQQYIDVLGREPDEGGFNYWTDQLLACGNEIHCVNARRRDIAAAFFIEQEFQETGSFIFDVYQGSLGRRPVFTEYSADRRTVGGGTDLEDQKAAFAQAFVQRAEFLAKYQANTSAESFVDALLQNARQSSGFDLSEQRDSLINGYQAGANLNQSRGLVVRAVADNAAFKQSHYNSAFVLTEYFAYLRRDPDADGYNFWINILSSGDANNYRGLVCSFITSTEYQRRFSSIISHSNAECGR